MKVICINNKYCEDRLTIGSKYNVIQTLVFHYKIIDDTYDVINYSKERFKMEEPFYNMQGVTGNKGPKGDDGVLNIRPDYYNDTNITPFDYIKANKLNFFEGNVIKYITRHRKKNGKEDLIKAKTYIEELIKEYDK